MFSKRTLRAWEANIWLLNKCPVYGNVACFAQKMWTQAACYDGPTMLWFAVQGVSMTYQMLALTVAVMLRYHCVMLPTTPMATHATVSASGLSMMPLSVSGVAIYFTGCP